MKKRYLTSLLLIGIMPFLTHCATQEDVNALNYHIRSLNKKVEDMKDTTVGQMQQRQASSSGLIDQLQADILQLKSQLEENSHLNRMLQEQNKELQLAVASLKEQQEQELNTRLAEHDNRIKQQEESLTAIRQARIEDAERRSKAAAQAAEAAMRKAREASAAQTASKQVDRGHISATSQKVVHSGASSAKPAVSTPQAASKPETHITQTAPVKPAVTQPASVDYFSEGQQKYNKGQYDEAYGLFEKHINTQGSKESTIPVRYMMGECLFKKGEYDQAIIQYQQIISNFPGNPQAAKALLRQGEAFEQLSDNETAKIIYKKVTASYGSTPEAEIARKRMSSL
ncbi:MAG: tetratricopeptide repeat protein [Proteobacteria bacterium]|nr:tetratricopeptide repeat protein [Pseudomonadota bacterium]MBU1138181.1 tetratricopeptide repeat protein [Pseudomonadota bacterium]MBU1233725.1 tetratricopeptide repeat protein [Pseudomonadota bacterium]MBU1420484.1 tetratricopeptide repeat protein [Pseudomonadota bacterium]MBU1456047.1 tetratricopeptide repeat protein [Pseudomonadota bacterium]